jgi:cytoskeletal protein CcmA (bactofilin family)
MSVVRPKLLADTFSMAGYDHIDPMTQWFLGGTATSGAEATGINDDDRYGLDLLNVGSGGLSLRATSGNGLHQVKVDNTSALLTGASFAGVTTFQSAVVMQTTLNVTGGVVFHSSLVVTGPALFADVTCTTLLVTTDAVVAGALDADSLTVDNNADIGGDVNVTNNLDVNGDVTINGTGSSLLVGTQTLWADAANNRVGIGTNSPSASHVLDVNGNVLFQDDVQIGGNLDMDQSGQTANIWDIEVVDDIGVGGHINLRANFDSGDGIPTSTNNSDGHFQILFNGTQKYVPVYNSP